MQRKSKNTCRSRNGALLQGPGRTAKRRISKPTPDARQHRNPITLTEIVGGSFLIPKNGFVFTSDGYSAEYLATTLYKILVRAYTKLGKIHILNDKRWNNGVTHVEIMDWLIDRCYEIKHPDTMLTFNDDNCSIIEWAPIDKGDESDYTINLSFMDKIKNNYEKDVMRDAISLMVHECQISLWDDGIFDMSLEGIKDAVMHNDEGRFENELKELEKARKEVGYYDEITEKLKEIKKHRPSITEFKHKIKEYGRFKPLFNNFFMQLIHCIDNDCKVYEHSPNDEMIEELEIEDSALHPWETMKFIWAIDGHVMEDYEMYINDTANNYLVAPWVQVNQWKETHYESFTPTQNIGKLQMLMSLLIKIKKYYEQLPRKAKPGLLVDILSGQEGEEGIL